MATMPNGLTADSESIGGLFQSLIKILALTQTNPNLARLTHLRQCLNSLRCGGRLKVSQNHASQAEGAVSGADWLRLAGAQKEFLRTWRESRVVLDVDHVAWCLDQLSQGSWLEVDPTLNFRPLGEQLETFTRYDEVVRHEQQFHANYNGIEALEFATVSKAVAAGIFTAGDLLFYCHKGNTLLTAEITRAYMNHWVGGIYGSSEPYIHGTPTEQRLFGPSVVRESAGSGNFPRPNGFYVKRLPTFADGARFATGKDYADVPAAEKAATQIWPMSSEALQIFGVTHKCYFDLRRPERLALPGFCVKEFDLCHIGGPGWDEVNKMYREKNINMLTIDTGVALGLGTLCRRTSPLTKQIGFGFMESWKPVQAQLPANETACSTCKKPLYNYDGFTICSFCGSIKDSN